MVRAASTVLTDAGKRLALVCFAMVMLAGICCGQDRSSPADWTQFLRNDMHRFNPYENVLSVKNVGNLKVKWTYATRFWILEASPAVANGALYLFSLDLTLYALDARTGGTLWTLPTAYGGSSVAVADGMVYYASNNVYALDARTGAEIWSFSSGNGYCGTPTALDGAVYVGCSDGNAYALNGHTGVKLWNYNTGNHYSSGCPAVANGIVYVNTQPASGNATLYALNAHTGSLIWSYSTDPYSGTSSPAVANGLVYIPPDNGTIYALNAKDGSVVWMNSIGRAGYDDPPAIAYGVIYVSSSSGIFALNARTGAQLWSFSDGYNPPAVANGVVYVSCPGSLCALNAHTGALLWSSSPRLRGFSPPVVVDGVVYAGAGDRNIYAFSLK